MIDERLGMADDLDPDSYLRRWRVELFMRDIKITMGLDVLRGQSPELVGREIWMQAIGYISSGL